MRVSSHIIVIVTTEYGRSVLCIHKQDRAGQWVNVFSMAMRLTLGRDEVERLTRGQKVRKPQSPTPSQAPIQLDILRREATHHPACSWEHQLLRRRREEEVERELS